MIGFVGTVGFGSSAVSARVCGRKPETRFQRGRIAVRAEAEVEETKTIVGLSPEEQAEKDAIMAALREDEETGVQRIILPNNRNLGATRDADGKSNIWAVEPKVTVDEQTSNYPVIIAACVAIILVGVAILPTLPLISPDAY